MLDPRGYAHLSPEHQAEVDGWLAEQGFVVTEVVSYQVIGEGQVELVVTDLLDGKPFARDGKIATSVRRIMPTTPPPHFK